MKSKVGNEESEDRRKIRDSEKLVVLMNWFRCEANYGRVNIRITELKKKYEDQRKEYLI